MQNIRNDALEDKGAFVNEIKEALLLGKIDLAVHRMKDMLVDTTAGLMFVPSPLREVANDMLVTPHPIISPVDLPKNSVIATGSKIRAIQFKEIRSDIKVVDIRGNVEMKIQKMMKGLDGILLSEASLKRLRLLESQEYHCIQLPISTMIPAPAQGILGIQIRDNDKKLLAILEHIKDEVANIQMLSERSFFISANKGCHVPIGAYAEVYEEKLILYGMIGREDERGFIRDSIIGTCDQAEELGIRLANKMDVHRAS